MKLTKKQLREQQEKAALRQRLADIAEGAYGPYQRLDFGNSGEEYCGMAFAMGIDTFARWLGGIKNALLTKEQEYLVSLRCLDKFETLDSATEHLYGAGVLA